MQCECAVYVTLISKFPMQLRYVALSPQYEGALTMGYALPGTPFDINQKTTVLCQSLRLLSQCSIYLTPC